MEKNNDYSNLKIESLLNILIEIKEDIDFEIFNEDGDDDLTNEQYDEMYENYEKTKNEIIKEIEGRIFK